MKKEMGKHDFKVTTNDATKTTYLDNDGKSISREEAEALASKKPAEQMAEKPAEQPAEKPPKAAEKK